MISRPEPLELDVALEQAMGSHHDIDRAARNFLNDRLVLAQAAEARHHIDLDRKLLEARGEGVEMLLGQDRRRHQHGDLPPVHHGDQRGAQGHLGFAEAGVAANQPVHRLDAGESRITSSIAAS